MSVFGPRVRVPSDASAALWIAPGLGEFGTVGGLVPDGFDRCVLVHPAHAVHRTLDDTSQLTAIAQIARRHTTTPDQVWFAIWEGYGWGSAATWYSMRPSGPLGRVALLVDRHRRRVDDRRRHERIRRGLQQVPQFDLPHRRYYLVTGSTLDAAGVCEPGTGGPWVPDLCWPEDRRWFVATDTDLEWTYIGGSDDFVAEVAAAFPQQSKLVHRHVRNDHAV